MVFKSVKHVWKNKDSHSSAQMELDCSTVQLYVEKMNASVHLYAPLVFTAKWRKSFLSVSAVSSSRLVHQRLQYDHLWFGTIWRV